MQRRSYRFQYEKKFYKIYTTAAGGPGDFCEACLMLERLCLCQTTWLCSALATLHTGQSEPNMHLGNKKDATGCQFFNVGESTFKIYEKLLF